jgi:2-polyprenyl-3-methyl-5-hydroxy-6-metoxy-1,4-benzoquinol methylase
LNGVDALLESRPCPLGCHEEDLQLFTGHDRLHALPGEFEVVRCLQCGLLRTNPRPTPAAMGKYYPDDYGPYLSTQVSSGASPRWKRLKTFLKNLIEFNAQRLPALPPGRMLEIGCASGSFLSRQANLGWQVAGIEFSPSAAARARQAGYEVHCGPVETAPNPQEQFDLVVGWMVLEHLHDPVGALRRLHAWTRPGATLVVSVPHLSPLLLKAFGNACYGLQVPTHLYHFTPTTLRHLLERGNWRLERVFHHRVLSCLLGSLGHRLRDSGHLPGVARWLENFPDRATRLHQIFYPLAMILAALGQTGRMTVWARRVDD